MRVLSIGILLMLLFGCAPSDIGKTREVPPVYSQVCVEESELAKWPKVPVTIYVQSFDKKIHDINGVYMDFAEYESIVEGTLIAVDTWNKAAGKTLLKYGGTIGKPQPKRASDALSDDDLVVYMQSDWIGSFIGKENEIIATAYIYASCDGKAIEASDIFLNTQMYYFFDTKKYTDMPDAYKGLVRGQRKIIDVASVLIHEIGHSLGLNHIPEARCPDSVMIPTIRVGVHESKRDLTQTDIVNISDLYGDGI